MTSPRKILATAAIVALVAGVSAADAAPRRRKPAPPKPVCKIIQDAKGDATEWIFTTGPNDPALDMISADLVTDATRVTAVWRMDKLTGDSTSWGVGRGFQTSFKVRGETLILQAVAAPNGNLWQNGAGTGTVDTAKNEVRMTVPIAKLRLPVKPGEKLTDIVATTWRTSGNTEFKVGRSDTANAVTPFYYVAGHPSCVKVGA